MRVCEVPRQVGKAGREWDWPPRACEPRLRAYGTPISVPRPPGATVLEKGDILGEWKQHPFSLSLSFSMSLKKRLHTEASAKDITYPALTGRNQGPGQFREEFIHSVWEGGSRTFATSIHISEETGWSRKIEFVLAEGSFSPKGRCCFL